LYTSKLPGSHNFKLCLCSSDIQANSAKLAETPDLSNIPAEYHEFANVFSKIKAEISAAQQHYQKSTNAQYSPASDFKVGDKVFVKAQFF